MDVISSIFESSFDVPCNFPVSVSKKYIYPVLVPTRSNLVDSSNSMSVTMDSEIENLRSNSDSPNSLSKVRWILLSVEAVMKAVMVGAWSMEMTSAECLGSSLILAPLSTLKMAVFP